VALVCARERATHYGATRAGLQGGDAPLVVYTSPQSHSSVEKAALLAGFGREHIRAVPVDAEFRMDPSALAAAISADRAAGLRPAAVVATSGTTAVTAFDPIDAIAAITQPLGLWLHVDGAMGGSAMALPEYRHLWAGIEAADSIVVNPHKWLSVAFDCSLYLVRDPEHLVRVMSTNPSYLQTAVDREVRNYRDWGIPLGRRFRALKIWFALRDQGIDGVRARLREHVRWAQVLQARLTADPAWQIVAPLTLQTLCVRHEPPGLTGEALDAHTRRWAQALNDSGQAYVTPAIIAGRWAVRLSIGAEYTRETDVLALAALCQAAATAA